MVRNRFGKEESTDGNPKLMEMIEAAGGQSELARLLSAESGERVEQSYIWRYTFEREQLPERLVAAGMRVAKSLGVDVKPKDLRPSLPVF